MNAFNRLIAIFLWLGLLGLICVVAARPQPTVALLLEWSTLARTQLTQWNEANPTNFLIGQIAAGVIASLIFGSLLWLEFYSLQRRGVRIRTTEGGSAEVDTNSIGRRLAWHLDQLAEINAVMPNVKSRGRAVDIRLEIEAAPDVDIPFKTNEVVDVTRDIIERDMGLKLGKLDVHLRCAPFEPEWAK